MNQSRVNASISPSFPRIGKRIFGISSLGKVFLGLLLLFTVPGKGRAETLQGTAIDPRRSPVPRATVRLLDAAGAEVARTLTDDQGRFHFEALAGTTYTVEVSLTGFETESAKAAPGQQVKIVLPVAPVRESVIVTATRTEAPTSQLGASTSVIPESEIRDRQAVFVSDLLQSVPGATVVRTGGLGALTSAFIRGGNSDYNKVLLDGIPLNEPGGFFNFSNFTVENLERVEVVRGPQSALFGSDAMTSVIQLFTRRGQAETRRPHFSLSAEGGKYSTWRARSSLTGQARALDYALDWSRVSTDNQDSNGFFHDTSLSGNFGLSFGERTTLRLVLRGELGLAGTPGQTAFGPPDRDGIFRRRDGFGAFTLRNRTASFWEQRVTYTLTKSRQVSRDLGTDPPFTPTFDGHTAAFQFFDFASDFLNDTRRHHLSYQSDWRAGTFGRPLGQHGFTFAFDWDREIGFLGDRFSSDLPTRPQRDNFGWTFQHNVLWQRLFLTSSARIEDNGSFGTTVVPRSSLAYLLRQGGGTLGTTKLKFNFGLGVKEPSFVESFSPSPFFRGNPLLAPERARSFDSGVEQRLWRDHAKLELNWFDNRFRDQVAFQIVNPQTFSGSFFNIGRAKAKGSEVVIEVAPRPGLRAVGSYTFLDSQITRSGSPFDPALREGQSLLRRPRHSGSLRVFWDWRRLNVTSSAVVIGRRVDSDFIGLLPPLTSSPRYTKWDLGGNYRSFHGLSYFGIVENLLNKSYMEALGFPALKLTFRAGVRIDF